MKTILYLILFLISSLTFAQDKVCADKEIQLENYLKDKDFEKANSLWLDINENCAKYSEKNYLLATQVLNYTIEVAKEEDKEKAVRNLVKMHLQYDSNFPENSNANSVKAAMALKTNKIGTDNEVFLLLDNAFTKQKDTFLDPTALNVYFKLFYDKYSAQNSTINKEELFKKYNEINSLLIENSKINPKKEVEYKRVATSIKALMNDFLVCENMIPYYEKNFEYNKTDGSWLLSAANSLSQQCKTAKIFETIALQMQLIEPSSSASYFLGDYYLNTRSQDKALVYFNEAIALEQDKLEKAKKAFSLALIYVNFDKEKSKNMILQAIENDTTSGKYYIFLSNLYASSITECGTTENEKMAIYQLSINTALKAVKIEPLLKPTAEKITSEFSKKIDNKLKGKTVTINCWINETVQF